MSTDDNKNTILWKRSAKTDATAAVSNDDTKKTAASTNKVVFKRNTDSTDSIPALDIATQAASHSGVGQKFVDTQSIDELRAEIDGAFGNTAGATTKKQDESPLLPITPKATTVDASSNSIDNLKAEIEQAFGGKEDPSSIKVESRNDNTISLGGSATKEPLLPVTPKANIADLSVKDSDASGFMPKKNVQEGKSLLSTEDANALPTSHGIAKDNHQALVDSLKADIKSDFDSAPKEEKTKDSIPSNTGVGQTYYSDLSKAMGANEPATMSELIKKSRFEKKEAAILSPKSKKNMAYIGAAILLLIASSFVIYSIFGAKKDPIEFVSEERVSSFVYANQDTGINVTGLESEKTKQVIRKVIEKKIPEDTINQIYYVEKTQNGGVRRLGVKDIFDKTDNQTPKLLYDNIENEFTHGVYKTDRNYPFVMLKALSYDRALRGMKEWEPDMLDDLATYFDLPPEGTDRSLIKDGFEDDLIRNKNVRVARFLPREVDRRGILDFLKRDTSQDPQPGQAENTVNTVQPVETLNDGGINTENAVEVDQQGNVVESGPESTEELTIIDKIQLFTQKLFTQPVVYAQNGGGIGGVGFGAADNSNGQRICYAISKSCISRSTGLTVPYQQGDTTQLCTDVRLNNTPVPSTPALEGDTLNYSCINTLSGGEEIGQGDALGQLSTTAPVCFNNQTGERLQIPDQTQFCFTPYRCNRLACKLNGIEVSGDRQGEPGVTCGEETPELVAADATLPNGEPMPKICRQFNDILSYQNINESPVCFDNQSNYLKYKTPNDPQLGFNCILPQNRSARLCVTQQQKIVVRTGNEIFTTDQFCFTPNQDAVTNIGVNDQCSDLTTAQIQSRLAWGVLQLRLIAGVGSLFGLSNQDVSNINQSADYIADLSQGNILQVEAARQTALVLQTLESILDRVDPDRQLPQNGPNGGLNVYGLLREIIDTVKCTLGIANTLQWSTLGQIPQGITIYAGQSLPGVEPVQQALALIGLMDPVSVSGTLDLLTQDAISQFQLANALSVTGILDPDTLAFIETVIENQDALYGGDEAIINDYFVISDENIVTGGTVDADGNIVTGGTVSADEQILTLGAYNNAVQSLQVLLYAEGYEVSNINGLFDEQTCSAVQQFQEDNNLEIADPTSCTLSPETLGALNDVIRAGGYLGSGFSLNPQGFLEGVGKLEGNFGPGVADYTVNEADADTLREGDIVLMYMFLDEETILIARDQIVIDEIIKRRVLSDIFTK